MKPKSLPVSRVVVILCMALQVFGVGFISVRPNPIRAAKVSAGLPVDIVIAVDTTGSMDEVIQQLQRDAPSILARIQSSFPEADFGVIQFRDYADSYQVQVAAPLAADVGAAQAALNQMEASGGEDPAEMYAEAVLSAVEDIQWRSTALHLLVVIGDAPPHDKAYGTLRERDDRPWAEAATAAANQGVKVAMIAVGKGATNPTVQNAFKFMTDATHGVFRAESNSSLVADDLVALMAGLGAAPVITQHAPAAAATEVPLTTGIQVTFNVPINPASLNAQTVELMNAWGMLVPCELAYEESAEEGTYVLRITPQEALLPRYTYRVMLSGEIVSAGTAPNHLTTYQWEFTTAGEPRDQVVKALERLRTSIKNLVEANGEQAAYELGFARAQTQNGQPEKFFDYLRFVFGLAPQAPEGLSAELVKAAEQMAFMGTNRQAQETIQWLAEALQAAPGGETEAHDYFLNKLRDEAILVDEREGGRIAASFTGYGGLTAQIDQDFDHIISQIPAALPQEQANQALKLINDVNIQVEKSRLGEQQVVYWDEESGLFAGNQVIGTIATQAEQFKMVVKGFNRHQRFQQYLKVYHYAGLGVKEASFVCRAREHGAAASPCSGARLVSEWVYWGSGMVDIPQDMVAVMLEPQEKLITSANEMTMALNYENVQLRRLFAGTAQRVKTLVTTGSPDVQAPVPGAAGASAPQQEFSIGEITLGDLKLPEEEASGSGTARVILANSSADTLQAVGYLTLHAHDSEGAASIASLGRGPVITLAPETRAEMIIPFDIPAARLVSPGGFEAQLSLAVLNVSTGQQADYGPYTRLVTAGTQAEIEAFHAALPTLLAGTRLENGQAANFLYAMNDPSKGLQVSLAQPLEGGLDLHVYDRNGVHVGFDYTQNETDVPAGTSYSGRNAARETVKIASGARGPFRIEVVSVDAPHQAAYDVVVAEYQAIQQYGYLPMILHIPSSAADTRTQVTAYGQPVAGLEVELEYQLTADTPWVTFANTRTDRNGQYYFAPRLYAPADRIYRVRWRNRGVNVNYLSEWICNPVAAGVDPSCNFDVQNVLLEAPDNGAAAHLPITFKWQMRPFDSDSYAVGLLPPSSATPAWENSPTLGYTAQYRLLDLPAGFKYGENYIWFVKVYTSGGAGSSYYSRSITLQAQPAGARPAEQAGQGAGLDIHPWGPLPEVEER